MVFFSASSPGPRPRNSSESFSTLALMRAAEIVLAGAGDELGAAEKMVETKINAQAKPINLMGMRFVRLRESGNGPFARASLSPAQAAVD